MWHGAGRIVGIEVQCVTVAAMFVHRQRLHLCTAALRFVALDAFNDAAPVRRNDASLIQMYGVIECQVGSVGSCGFAHEQMPDFPFDVVTWSPEPGCGPFDRLQQAELELGMGIEKIGGILEPGGGGQFRMTIRTKALVLLDEFGSGGSLCSRWQLAQRISPSTGLSVRATWRSTV